MKNFLYLSIIIAILATTVSSCKREEQKVESTKQIDNKDSLLIDSLTTVIKNIGSSDYDLVVAELKKLPKYENALFLTSKENQEYLNAVQKNADRFRLEDVYKIYPASNWERLNDSILFKYSSRYYSCKIIFDTTQSSKPLLTLTISQSSEEKNVRTKEVEEDYDKMVYSYYYIPNLKIGYVISTFSFTTQSQNKSYSSSFYSDLYSNLEEEVLKDFKRK